MIQESKIPNLSGFLVESAGLQMDKHLLLFWSQQRSAQAQGCAPRHYLLGQAGITGASLNLFYLKWNFPSGTFHGNGFHWDKKYTAGGQSMSLQRLTNPIERVVEGMYYHAQEIRVYDVWGRGKFRLFCPLVTTSHRSSSLRSPCSENFSLGKM